MEPTVNGAAIKPDDFLSQGERMPTHENTWDTRAKIMFNEASEKDKTDSAGDVRSSLNAAHHRYSLVQDLDNVQLKYRSARRMGNRDLMEALVSMGAKILAEIDEIDKSHPESKDIMLRLVKPQTERDLQKNIEREIAQLDNERARQQAAG